MFYNILWCSVSFKMKQFHYKFSDLNDLNQICQLTYFNNVNNDPVMRKSTCGRKTISVLLLFYCYPEAFTAGVRKL